MKLVLLFVLILGLYDQRSKLVVQGKIQSLGETKKPQLYFGKFLYKLKEIGLIYDL